jgi:hypothetical protein
MNLADRTRLKAALIQRYGQKEGFDRFLAQVDGSDPDVQRWNNICRCAEPVRPTVTVEPL